MLKNPHPGIFVAIEGLDGSGKSTQVAAASRYLGQTGRETFITFEPSGSAIGNMIRSRLLGEWQSSPQALQLLFAADRAEHLEKEIIPRLLKGICVITDRYAFSSFAYGAIENDLDWLVALNSRFLAPDLVVYLESTPEACLERIRMKRDSIELFEKSNILKEVTQNYKVLFKRDDFKNVPVAYIDMEKSVDAAAQEISVLINKIITKKAVQAADK